MQVFSWTQVKKKKEKVNWEGRKQNLRANTDYALNVQLIMEMHEIGRGGTESNIVMLFLNLAQGSTMKTTTFHKIEDKLGFLIRKISLKLMLEALKEEVRLQLIEDGREEDYVKWLAGEK
mmetsp:Transcript_6410/g.7874  ORF Transcript_6410/g.7874 Transcript_6410/m.7874 type:complete len:120 (+) Transcript_6410:418-777(+)